MINWHVCMTKASVLSEKTHLYLVTILNVIIHHYKEIWSIFYLRWIIPKLFIETLVVELDNFVDGIPKHCLKFGHFFVHDLLVRIPVRRGLELGDRKGVLGRVGTSRHQWGHGCIIRYRITNLKNGNFWKKRKTKIAFEINWPLEVRGKLIALKNRIRIIPAN